MSQFLRDETSKNLTMSEKALTELNIALIKIRDEGNKECNNATKDPKYLILTYIIRFDGKGFKLYQYDKAMEYFRSAKEVERFTFQLYSAEYFKAFKQKGRGLEIRFDSKAPNNCFLNVDDDQQRWVESTFLTIKEIIKKYDSKNYLMRNTFVVFSIQILGVLAGILLSLWIASMISPKLNMPYPFGIAFIISLLIFSNLWTYFYVALLRCVDYFWPNISFQEIKGLRKIIRNTVLTLLIGGCVSIIYGIICKSYNFISSLIK